MPRERYIKRLLLQQIKESKKVDAKDLVEWLWEDFGIRCKPLWREIERKVVKSDEILANDLAIFMLERGIVPKEEIWFEDL